ncbi:MAG: helix-turn-helix transcriptional regulator [Betaproteobacteria bacterium]|nr:helix-turn-helix transcriptional regulator [Betaproteobacteria bacterium]
MKIGDAIRTVRLEQGATLEKIALAAGTDAANLSRIERGKQGFTPEMIARISTALKLPVSALYSRVEQATAAYRVAPVNESAEKFPEAELFASRFGQLNSENQHLVLEFVKTLLKWQKQCLVEQPETAGTAVRRSAGKK